MARRTGITSNTCKRFIIDSGAVYKNWGTAGELLIGATRGGNTFKIETELKEMEVDGAHVALKGCRRITKVTGTLTVNFLEMTKELFELANPAATAADYPSTPAKTHDLITRAADVALTDYITNIAIVGDNTYSDTNEMIVVLENVLADGNIEMGFSDKDESVITVNFMAHQDPTNLATEPWKIYSPFIA